MSENYLDVSCQRHLFRLVGLHKFGAQVYFSCLEGEIFNPNQCVLEATVYSCEFEVNPG